MRIVCIGGGPAGLFFSIVMKSARPDAEIVVLERNKPDDTFGWGVVFSDQTLGNIAAADPTTYERIVESFVHWDDIDVHYRGRVIRVGGQGFAGLARKKLLNILQSRALEVGVDLRFEIEANDEEMAGADVLVIADGANSPTRRKYAERFGEELADLSDHERSASIGSSLPARIAGYVPNVTPTRVEKPVAIKMICTNGIGAGPSRCETTL